MSRKTFKQNYYFLPYNKKLYERSKELLNNQTEGEQKIYIDYFSKLNLRVRKQKIIDNFIVDFYIPKIKLVIEIDGEIHDSQEDYDKERSILLEKYNLRIIRIKNKSILNTPEITYKKLDEFINKLLNKN